MLVRQGDTRSDISDRQLACTLAAVAGALNAAAFYAVGFFSANMTGNVSILSDHLATGQFGSASFYLSIVGAFMGGAATSTLIINAGHHLNFQGIYALVVLLEAAAMAGLGGADLWLPPAWRNPAVVLSLAFLMGLQNAVVTRISNARVRTTHVSGMATDIGIEIGLLLDGLVRRRPAAEGAPIRARLRLHAETILSFLIGGVFGVALYRWIGGGMLWLVAAFLAAVSLAGLRGARMSRTGDAGAARRTSQRELDL